MAERHPRLDEKLRAFIARQRIFFTATAAPDARVNLSPREGGALRVVDDLALAYLDRTGSGNETAAHLRADGRMTIMLCAFEGPPMILRLYGQGRILHRDSASDHAMLNRCVDGKAPDVARQIVRLDIDIGQTSRGFGVPLFDYKEDRTVLERWARGKSPDGISAYWREKNMTSIDGLPTGILEAPQQ